MPAPAPVRDRLIDYTVALVLTTTDLAMPRAPLAEVAGPVAERSFDRASDGSFDGVLADLHTVDPAGPRRDRRPGVAGPQRRTGVGEPAEREGSARPDGAVRSKVTPYGTFRLDMDSRRHVPRPATVPGPRGAADGAARGRVGTMTRLDDAREVLTEDEVNDLLGDDRDAGWGDDDSHERS
ncbi:hypothetical protein GCM10010182_01270 [Actinomadura cremea]|nr:hypothetical protein GCM10010182_01270 [Actinomadura cremea]